MLTSLPMSKAIWSQRRGVWAATLVAAYLLGAGIWSGATLMPTLIPSTLYYAPTGLLRCCGIEVFLFPDPRPPIIGTLLPAMHLVFWPGLLALLVFLRKLPPRLCTVLYGGFATLLLLNLGGCLRVAGF